MKFFWVIIDKDGNTLQTLHETFKPQIGESIILEDVSWRITDIKYGVYTLSETHANRVFMVVQKEGAVHLVDHQHLLTQAEE